MERSKRFLGTSLVEFSEAVLGNLLLLEGPETARMVIPRVSNDGGGWPPPSASELGTVHQDPDREPYMIARVQTTFNQLLIMIRLLYQVVKDSL